MSQVAHRASALVPSEASFEGLTKRLLALRAEIDAILAELSSHAMTMSHAAAATVAGTAVALTPRAEEDTAATEQELLPVLSDPPADGQSKLESCGMVEEAEAASESSVGESETGEFLEPSDIVTASDAVTPIAAIDIDAAERADNASVFAEAEVAPTADASSEMPATEAVSAEQQGDAAMLDAPQQPVAQQDSALSTADGPRAGDSPVMPATDADEALADAAVISLHARQRKHKGGLATGTSMPARSRRHVAAKIAASILVLLTAATLLVMADRTAFGSVQSLPWISPTPSGPTGIDWLLQRLKAAAMQLSDDAARRSDLPLDDGPLAVHPVAWGS